MNGAPRDACSRHGAVHALQCTTIVQPRLNKPALLVGGIALTLAALVAVEWLPRRVLALTEPGAVSNLYLSAPPQPASGPAPVQWVDAHRLHLRCLYTEPQGYQPCGLTLVLGSDDPTTVSYTHLTLPTKRIV